MRGSKVGQEVLGCFEKAIQSLKGLKESFRRLGVINSLAERENLEESSNNAPSFGVRSDRCSQFSLNLLQFSFHSSELGLGGLALRFNLGASGLDSRFSSSTSRGQVFFQGGDFRGEGIAIFFEVENGVFKLRFSVGSDDVFLHNQEQLKLEEKMKLVSVGWP